MKYLLIMILALPVIPGRDKHGLPPEAKNWQQTEPESKTTTNKKSYEEKGPKGPQAQEEAKDKDFSTETSPKAIQRKQQGY